MSSPLSRASGAIRALILVAVLVFGACASPPSAAPDLTAPNVLFIVIDCLRSDHVGSYGYHRPTTPNLDALTREGTVFENAYAQSYWTRPSVVSYLTGLYPSEHGLLDLGTDSKLGVVGQALAPEAVTMAEDFKSAGYITAMVGEQHQLSRAFDLDQGFDFYRNRAGKAAQIGKNFVGWLDRHQGEGPFFGYLHYLDIHWPYCPSKRFRDRFDTGESDLATCHEWRDLRDRIRSGEQVLTQADIERLAARYDEELVSVDASFGTLFPQLQDRGLWDETLVIVTSDHGEEFMEHGSIGHRGSLWDVLLSVPLIVKPPASWPGEPAPRVTDLVELRSLAPTMRQAIGVPPGRGGPSLIPYLLGDKPAEVPRYAVGESDREVRVRSASHALFVSKIDGSSKLFDRTAEPLERTDVSSREPEVMAELTRALRAWRAGLEPLKPATADVDRETIEGLEALGYID